MQSWPNTGGQGGSDATDNWSNAFAYTDQNGGFGAEADAQWAPTLPTELSFPPQQQSQLQQQQQHRHQQQPHHHTLPHQHQQQTPDSSHATAHFFDHHDPALYGVPTDSVLSHGGFHPSHDNLDLNHTLSRAEQDALDPAFSNLHPDMFSQSGKVSAQGARNEDMGRMQHNMGGHGHTPQQNYGHAEYSFIPQENQQYRQQVNSFPQQQMLAAQHRQATQSRSPVQQQSQAQAQQQQQQQQQQQPPRYDSMANTAVHGHAFANPARQSPVQHQPSFSQPGPYINAANGQPGHYQPNVPIDGRHMQQQQQQPQDGTGYTQKRPQAQPSLQPHQEAPTNLLRPNPIVVAKQARPIPSPQHIQQTQPPQQQPDIQHAALQHQQPQYIAAQLQPTHPHVPTIPQQGVGVSNEHLAVNGNANVQTANANLSRANAVGEATQRSDETDSYVIPAPTLEELQMIEHFRKSDPSIHTKIVFPNSLPYAVVGGSVKLPAPKVSSQMTPVVAMPARSGKRILGQVNADLPCEVQGRFTSKYRPASDKSGLDERRSEADALLSEYDRSMKALGKRRPKYSEYPHAFKEQLKADEAWKNKFEKKAKKEQAPDRHKAIRSLTRPADPIEGIAWDTIGVVHVEDSIARTNALIAGRVQQAGELFIKLRADMNKAKQDVDKAVTDKSAPAELSKLRETAAQKKEMLFRALDATVEHADDAVLDNLGGHQKLITSLVNVLISCFKANDFSGKLPKITLELFSHFPMTKKIAETTNFDLVLRKFSDKGDDEVKDFARDIATKVKKLAKEQDTTTGYTGTSAASRAAKASSKSATDPVASTKRARDDDTADTRTVKKVAVESGGGSLSKKLAQPKIQLQSASKTTNPKPVPSSLLPGKSRTAAKPTGKAETARTGSPATEDKAKTGVRPDATRPVAVKAEPKPAAPKMGAPPSASALSGIASLLDSINAPPPEAAGAAGAKDRGASISETPEQRAKRLKKEARRNLRVSWKPESDLVQVRVFEKEDSENEGRASNMIRDAADDRSEGMVLKQRADVEEDDEDDDIPYQPWEEPIAADFSTLDPAVRSKNFVTRGGVVSFSTQEQKSIADREQRELMVIYTDPSDIPPTPKSPMPSHDAAPSHSQTVHLPQEPKFEEMRRRWTDIGQLGVEGSLYAATKRLDAKKGPSGQLDSILGRLRGNTSTRENSPASATSTKPSHSLPNNIPLVIGPAAEEAVLAWLNSEAVRNYYDPDIVMHDSLSLYHYRSIESQAAGAVVDDVAQRLFGKPFPAMSPPAWLLQDKEREREWWFCHNKETAAKQKKLAEEQAKKMAGVVQDQSHVSKQGADWTAFHQQQQQQQQFDPYMALLQQMGAGQQGQTGHAPPPPAPIGNAGQVADPQLQSLLAAMGQAGPQNVQPPSAASFLNPIPIDQGYRQLMMLTEMAQQNTDDAGQQSYSAHDDPYDQREHDHFAQQREKERDRDGNKKKRGTLPPHKPANKALIGTKACTFWQQGKCARGDKCTFRHD